MPRQCPNCKTMNRDTAAFCDRCGSPLIVPTERAAPVAGKPTDLPEEKREPVSHAPEPGGLPRERQQAASESPGPAGAGWDQATPSKEAAAAAGRPADLPEERGKPTSTAPETAAPAGVPWPLRASHPSFPIHPRCQAPLRHLRRGRLHRFLLLMSAYRPRGAGFPVGRVVLTLILGVIILGTSYVVLAAAEGIATGAGFEFSVFAIIAAIFCRRAGHLGLGRRA